MQIYGQEASGKTTLALAALAEAQKAGGAVCLVSYRKERDLASFRKLCYS